MKLDDITLEDTLPNKPNFLLIVILFGATILVLAIGALVLLHMEGKHINFMHHKAQPNARVVLPGAARPGAAA